ncbi:peptidoglycan catabolic process [Bacillus phage vB_BceS_LY5]|uniref:peptidoglycan catabolic process n=1 Tax=Bacillus phage vB_BceS_LY5 TaxID=2996058 RepID=UPI004054EEDC|nr:peptidoglycan catabolic process [Bacillus phage vB_BceS_LY5]
MYKRYTSHAGHTRGGGARGSGYEESAVARQFNPVLIKALQSVGAEVHDCTDNVSTTQNANLSRLVSLCNAVNRDGRLDISLHFNSSDNPASTGVEVLYYDQRDLAAKVSAAISKASGLRDRGPVQRKDLAVLNGTNAPAILIELAFISNASDMKKFFDNMQAIANAIVQAVTGKTTSGGGGNPMPNDTVITTGAFSPYEVPDVCGALKSLNMTGVFKLEPSGLTYLITDPTSDAQFKACKDYLDRKGWWHDKK